MPAEPPRDALLHDAAGDVWAHLAHEDAWTRISTQGPAMTCQWPDLITEHGPVDVLVWRGRVAAPEGRTG